MAMQLRKRGREEEEVVVETKREEGPAARLLPIYYNSRRRLDASMPTAVRVVLEEAPAPPDDICPIAQEPISEARLEFLLLCENGGGGEGRDGGPSPPPLAFDPSEPALKAMRLDCGHRFAALHLLYHWVRNDSVLCPVCRGGPVDARLRRSELPPHLRDTLVRRANAQRDADAAELIEADAAEAGRLVEEEGDDDDGGLGAYEMLVYYDHMVPRLRFNGFLAGMTIGPNYPGGIHEFCAAQFGRLAIEIRGVPEWLRRRSGEEEPGPGRVRSLLPPPDNPFFTDEDPASAEEEEYVLPPPPPLSSGDDNNTNNNDDARDEEADIPGEETLHVVRGLSSFMFTERIVFYREVDLPLPEDGFRVVCKLDDMRFPASRRVRVGSGAGLVNLTKPRGMTQYWVEVKDGRVRQVNVEVLVHVFCLMSIDQEHVNLTGDLRADNDDPARQNNNNNSGSGGVVVLL